MNAREVKAMRDAADVIRRLLEPSQSVDLSRAAVLRDSLLLTLRAHLVAHVLDELADKVTP